MECAHCLREPCVCVETRAAGSSAPACSAGELTADDIKLIDNCLAHCECSLESAGTGYTALFKMACTYTRERVAEVREKLKPNHDYTSPDV